ncbi:MAG: FkbM family methyltransferase [Prochlorococcaceae cyanobacterium]
MILQLHRSDLEDSIAAYLHERLPMAPMEVVFDVGANHGWFTYLFLQHYPQSNYYLFEPVRSIHAQCLANLGRFEVYHPERTLISRMALSSSGGEGRMTAEPGVTVNHLVGEGGKTTGQPTETVTMTTGAAFCAERNIHRINFLKIDCEGHDFEVLKGFETLLIRAAVDFVQVECSMSGSTFTASSLQPFERVNTYLRNLGYELLRFTNQASDSLPFLARADVVWIHRSVAEALAVAAAQVEVANHSGA